MHDLSGCQNIISIEETRAVVDLRCATKNGPAEVIGRAI